jgi:putative FmdB family regulatory protein
MPTYEYECSSCHHRFEVFQSMSDQALTDCPACGKSVRRVIGGGMGIIFRGSGFYRNDARSAGAASGGKKEGLAEGAKPEAAKAEGGACAACPAKADASCPAAKP